MMFGVILMPLLMMDAEAPVTMAMAEPLTAA
jgi:hypothetical protein